MAWSWAVLYLRGFTGLEGNIAMPAWPSSSESVQKWIGQCRSWLQYLSIQGSRTRTWLSLDKLVIGRMSKLIWLTYKRETLLLVITVCVASPLECMLIVQTATVNVDTAKAVGYAILASMEGKTAADFSFWSEWSSSQPQCQDCSQNWWWYTVHIDPQLLFQRLTIAAKEVDNIENIFKYELCSYPLALFDSSLHCKNAGVPSTPFAWIWCAISIFITYSTPINANDEVRAFLWDSCHQQFLHSSTNATTHFSSCQVSQLAWECT